MGESLEKEDINNIIIEELVIRNGEHEIYGTLYTPRGEGKHPVVILSHGYNGTNADFVNECIYFAENGYIAYAYDFCGGSVQSRSSGKSTDMTIFTEKGDLLAVYHRIENMENADPRRIFLFGGSQGGLVSALAAEQLQDGVRGLVLYFPAFNIPDDWRERYASADEIPQNIEFWGMDLGKDYFMSIRDFYTFTNIGAYSKNILIIYGADDDIVPIGHMLTAQQVYKNAQLVILPNEGHGFSSDGAKEAMELALRFMEKQQ